MILFSGHVVNPLSMSHLHKGYHVSPECLSQASGSFQFRTKKKGYRYEPNELSYNGAKGKDLDLLLRPYLQEPQQNVFKLQRKASDRKESTKKIRDCEIVIQ